eukprot:TRINITY_DN5279_c0_g1_i2.p1 TRINITY_DN5279_c0_g1~~TRINITY_DN5279_c0_g1_i2.p1  ORF type:complete len:520 (-),score=88.71 TRINITY_DN5279_c0_g1_i2:46-1605(-)
MQNVNRIRQAVSQHSSEARRRPSKGTAEDMSDWSDLRRAAGKLSESDAFEVSICTVVFINTVFMVFEADSAAACHGQGEDCLPKAFFFANTVMLAIYAFELLLHIFVQRLSFVCFAWNLLDLSIVLLGLVELILITTDSKQSGFSLMRMMKVMRIVRVARLVKAFPELYKFVQGFMGTVRAMFWGFVVIMMLLLVWGIITVQVLNSYEGLVGSFEDDWCNQAFQTVGGTVVLFFQTLVAGDSWGLCVVPIIRQHTILFLLFSSVLVTVQLGFTNLILAVIVDASAEAREDDVKAKVKEIKRQREQYLKDMHDLIKRLDVDRSGTITLEELHKGYDEDPRLYDKFTSLGIDKNDMDTIFKAMDNDNSGDVDYEEFVSAFMKAEQNETRAQSMLLHLRLENLHRILSERFESIEAAVKAYSVGDISTGRSGDLGKGNSGQLFSDLESLLRKMENRLGERLQQTCKDEGLEIRALFQSKVPFSMAFDAHDEFHSPHHQPLPIRDERQHSANDVLAEEFGIKV